MTTRKIRLDYKVYYFSSLDKVDPRKISGNAILLVGMIKTLRGSHYADVPLFHAKFETHTYLIKDHCFALNQDKKLKTYTLKLDSRENFDEDKFLELFHNQDTYKEIICDNKLFLCAYRVAHDDAFPYEHDVDTPPYLRLAVTISEDGKKITVNRPGHEKEFLTSEMEFHPIFTDYLRSDKNKQHNMLTLLYKIQASSDFKNSKIYHSSKSFKANAWPISIEKAIALFHKGNGTKYLSIDEFEHKANIICSRFSSSLWTQQKADVFNDFIAFYKSHQNDPDFMPRTVLIERWVNNYMQDHDDNPFVVLNQQRRTGFLSIFNPVKTASISLFNDFLSGEIIPASLNEKMQQTSFVSSSNSKELIQNRISYA